MKSTINLQKLKGLLLANGLLAVVLAAPGIAVAAGTGTASVDDIKDTNYSVPAGAIFVAPDGKDSNTGKSYDSPLSVNKAIASAPSGATIVFKGGVYRNVDTGISKKLTLQAYPREKPLLKGSIEVTGWAAEGNIWRKDGWMYSFTPNMDSENIDPNYPMAGYRDMVYVNGVSLKQVASKAEVTSGTFYLDSANRQLYIGDNPTAKVVEATALLSSLRMSKNASSDPSNTIIRGLGFAHYADRAITVGAPNITFENNTFVWNGQNGVWLFGGSDHILRGNIFSYNGRNGVSGGNMDRILVEENTFSYNNVERFNTKWDAAGIKIARTDGLIFRNNIVENNFSTGMWMDISSSNATVVNNTVRHNEELGIFFELSHKAIIAGNVAHHNNVGIIIADSSNARVYNNTLSLNNQQILVKDSIRENTNLEEKAAGITWITSNNVIKNNILSDAEDTAINASGCRPSALMIANSDYNAYYRPLSNVQPILSKWSLSSSQCLVKYLSLTIFNSATGFEQRGLSVDNVAINPFFVDEVNGDYRLKSGSSAIGRGEMLPADIASAIRVAPGVPVDLGALQSKVVLVQ